MSTSQTTAPERKYALSKIATGDYLLLSNDAQTFFRISSYTDGPSMGLDWPRDRTVWVLRRWTGEVGIGCFVDTSADSERWEEVETCIPTRREAIDTALAA